ncbi:MAG: GntR family transcriptional regulator [Lautropia sp.]
MATIEARTAVAAARPPREEQDVALRIERMILGGELPPGGRVREVALAERLGVGRGPLREAIRILEGRRLLVRTANAGVSVFAPSVDDFEQILYTREALEGMAARQAAENMTSAEIRALHRMVDSLEPIDMREREPFGVFDTGPDSDFHRNIALGSRNQWIVQLLCDDLYSILRLMRFRAASVRTDPSPSHVEHRAIIERIQQRDPDGAEALMRAHVQGSRNRLLAHLRAGLC